MRMGKALEKRKLTLENREYQQRLEQKVKQHVEQMQQYYQESVEALTREQVALEESQNVRTVQQGDASIGAGVAVKSRESSIKEFARKLSQLFGRGVSPDSLGATESPAIVQTETAVEGTKNNLALYDGTVELKVSSNTNLEQIIQLHSRLKSIRQLRVSNVYGSVDKDVTIRLSLEKPMPLLNTLKDMPEIEKVIEKNDVDNKIDPTQEGEASRARKIVVKLTKKAS
jgi:hypothetical protein